MGQDAISVLVNVRNPIRFLSKQQLKDIFTGKVTNWEELGGDDLAIRLYIVKTASAFAASVINGPLANSGIGQVIKPLLNTSEAKQIIMQDFTAYALAYNDQVAFIASPVFEEEMLLGYMVFEMGSKGIDNVMTTSGKWRDAGLGETGESFLV